MATTNNFTFGVDAHPFTLNFPFIDEDNLVVTLDGVVKTLDTDYTVINKTSNTAAGVGFLSGAQIQFTASPLPTTGAVKVVRNTTLETTSTFKTGSAIRAVDLNSNFTQNLYVTEEISNNAILTDGSNAFDGNLNMGGNRITNLGTPTTDSDAVTKTYVDSRFSSTAIPGYTRWSTTATASQIGFSGVGESGGTLAYSSGRENVYVNGVLQQRGVDYNAQDGSTVAFATGLIAGDIVEVVCVNNVSTVTSDQSSEVYFLQSGTGATTRTVESKLKDVVSVKDFGAVGDGVVDDTAAIQAAIDYIQSLNPNATDFTRKKSVSGTVYLPAGKYKVTSTLFIDQSGVALIGDSFTTTSLYRTTNYGDTIRIQKDRTADPVTQDIYNVEIKDLSIESTIKILTESSHIAVYGAYDLKLLNIQFRDGAYRCIDLRGCVNYILDNITYYQSNTNLWNSYVAPSGSAFIRLRGNNTGSTFHTVGTSTGRITNCFLIIYPVSTQAPFEYGYHIGIADGVWLTNCYSRNSTKSCFGLVPFDEFSRVSGVRMLHTWSDECNGDATVLIEDTTGGTSPQFNHNIIGHNVNGQGLCNYGIKINNPNVSNIHIADCFIGTTGLEGINVVNFVKDVNIHNCTVYNSNLDLVAGTPEVRFADNLKDFSVTHNKLGGRFNNDLTGTSTHAITIGTNCSRFVVSGNRVTNTTGIGINNGSYSTMVDAVISDNIGYNTPKKGTAQITASTTTITVAHGQDTTPSPGEILVTKQGAYSTANNFYVTNITANAFDIVVDVAPAVNLFFGYSVRLDR